MSEFNSVGLRELLSGLKKIELDLEFICRDGNVKASSTLMKLRADVVRCSLEKNPGNPILQFENNSSAAVQIFVNFVQYATELPKEVTVDALIETHEIADRNNVTSLVNVTVERLKNDVKREPQPVQYYMKCSSDVIRGVILKEIYNRLRWGAYKWECTRCGVIKTYICTICDHALDRDLSCSDCKSSRKHKCCETYADVDNYYYECDGDTVCIGLGLDLGSAPDHVLAEIMRGYTCSV